LKFVVNGLIVEMIVIILVITLLII